jgi:hypothetical protein
MAHDGGKRILIKPVDPGGRNEIPDAGFRLKKQIIGFGGRVGADGQPKINPVVSSQDTDLDLRMPSEDLANSFIDRRFRLAEKMKNRQPGENGALKMGKQERLHKLEKHGLKLPGWAG